MQDIDELREKYLNRDFDEVKLDIKPDVTTEFARLCGETASRFLDANDPDFQAPPTFIATLSGRRSMPEDFPRFGIGMDAGKAVECFLPIKPGSTLTARTHLHDIYTKSGRSGRMVFVVSRLAFYDDAGNHLANSDSRLVMREKS